mgnify:CR=1 FL=1
MGVFFAVIYRIPQVVKLYRTKKGSDISKKSFILHNGLKNKMDYILLGYYCIGSIQNGIIISMKHYLKIRKKTVHSAVSNEATIEICSNRKLSFFLLIYFPNTLL